MKKRKLLTLFPIAGLLLAGCSFSDLMFWKEKNNEPQEQQKQEEEQKGGEEEQGGKEEQKQASLSIDKSSISLKVGETERLYASAKNGTGDVLFESDNETVATVDARGLIEAKAEGQATITAKYSGLSKTCAVTVVPADAKVVKSITLSPSTFTLDLVNATSATITPVVQADEGVDTTVTWASDDTSVATVSKASGAANESITITAVGEGNAVITARCGDKEATATVEVIHVNRYSLVNMYENANIVEFRENVADSEHVFRGGTVNVIEVGDENPFQMLPVLDIIDEDTFDPIDQDEWAYPYQFDIKMWNGSAFETVSKTQYAVFDETNCTFDFVEAAREHRFQLDVYPGGLSETQLANAEFHSVVTVDVFEGYNVYDADRLAFMNDVAFAGSARQDGSLRTGQEYNDGWLAFRQAKGLSTTYLAPRILLQSNIKLLKENLPDIMFFSASEGVAAEQVGKMVDSTDVYARYADGFTFNGNYFNIDTSELPLNGNQWGSDGISHSTLFKVAEIRNDASADSSLTFKNCTYYGNGPRGNNPDEANSLIFFKVQNYHNQNTLVTHALFENFNVTRACISFYSEYGPTVMTIKDCKISEGYSNGIFLYMNGDLVFDNSELTNFGGPIIVTNGKDDTVVGFHISVDDKTVLENWVAGNEPWFNSTGAVAAIPQIQTADGLPNYFGYTFLKGSDKLMNFVLVNRGDNAYVVFDGGIEGEVPVGFDRNTADVATIDTYMAGGAVRMSSSNGTNFLYMGNMSDVTGPIGGKYFSMAQNMGSPFGVVAMVFELIPLA